MSNAIPTELSVNGKNYLAKARAVILTSHPTVQISMF